MNASFPLQAAIHHPPELLMQAQGVRAVIFDVDGVLTDGGLYYGESGELFKRFHVLDGLGLKQIVQEDIVPIVITGRDSKALRARLNALGITEARYGVEDKLAEAEALLKSLGLGWHEVAVMGDDWPDLPLMVRAALSAAPANAHPQVQSQVHFVTRLQGGHGAARELCDLLLIARGAYVRQLDELLEGKS
ncbi:3-deoxy-D-manno-octulosonate 8-phosphate phosphatase [Comamonas serinivorans]|uniref:3-deoxy-D-manno-octulosonate 8-phosphate phosphatase KdsC n=1 Tax=Comamonas serinivorans TaxID=1082851 RepID=A0A1Y0EIR3_9BURK|nr:HAD hydrolase family protein [Comamonas serinivorans]ARU03311.1 3-deoxy-D-manno-octulosonate 8-phosphate phosphatase [Comamonas serinivorans]